MVTLLQLVLVGLLVLLYELSVPLQGIAAFLEKFFEAKPQLVFMLRGNFPVEQISEDIIDDLDSVGNDCFSPEEHSCYFYRTLVDCSSNASLQFHLQDLGIVRLHGSVQLGYFHLNVLYGNFYWSQDNLLLLSNLSKDAIASKTYIILMMQFLTCILVLM